MVKAARRMQQLLVQAMCAGKVPTVDYLFNISLLFPLHWVFELNNVWHNTSR